jgi:hypothetical protein
MVLVCQALDGAWLSAKNSPCLNKKRGVPATRGTPRFQPDQLPQPGPDTLNGRVSCVSKYSTSHGKRYPWLG